jgi:hypothetical protein
MGMYLMNEYITNNNEAVTYTAGHYILRNVTTVLGVVTHLQRGKSQGLSPKNKITE